MNPIILLSAAGIASLFTGIFQWRKLALPLVTLACAVAFILLITGYEGDYGNLLTGMLSFDTFSIAFSSVLLIITIAVLVLCGHYYRDNTEHLTDIYALFLFSLVGGILLSAYNNLIMLFLGIEVLSIPLYILAASNRKNLFSNEAGLKYFLMGSFATCFLLLGITLIYGMTGTFMLNDISNYLASTSELPTLFIVGVILIIGAFVFKVSAAPFHFWAPDVYQGSPTVVTAFMATVVKTAAFGAFLRFLMMLPSYDLWQNILTIVAVLTMLTGNIIALYQNNLKRLLAYSGIANAGFVLIALTTLQENSWQYVLYYMAGYSIASIIAFAVYIIVKENNNIDTTEGLRGIGANNRFLVTALSIAMLSLAGIPPMAGFFGKYAVFSNSVSAGNLWLVIVAILNSLLGVYYYLRVMVISLQPQAAVVPHYKLTVNYQILLFTATVLLVLLGMMPGLLLDKL